MQEGTGVSGFKSQDLLPPLTSCVYQGSHDKVIEEVNSSVSCWIAKVASTGAPRRLRLEAGGQSKWAKNRVCTTKACMVQRGKELDERCIWCMDQVHHDLVLHLRAALA
jgi:hypothetical protein